MDLYDGRIAAFVVGRIQGRSQRLLRGREQVPVNIEGRLNVAVPQVILDCFGVGVGGDEQRGAGVP